MPEAVRRIQFIADRGDARLRLDQILVRRVADVARASRSRAQQWIQSGSVSIDGKSAVRPSQRVKEGARVELSLPERDARREPEPENRTLDVIYEDDDLLAINKPAGVVVHPAFRNTSGTILNAVLHRVTDRPVRPGIVTRLDKETSGLMLIALTPGVHARLQRTKVSKEYLAIVSRAPRPRRGTIDLPLARDPHDRRRMIVGAAGVPSTTRYEVIASNGELSLVRCELVTGRTHQIRVHLSAKGWPIVGDAVYGLKADRIGRVALHSERVRFVHPVTGAQLELTVPMPDDMRHLLGA